MSLAKLNNHNIYYEIYGDRNKPVIFMGHSLLWDSHMFHNQIDFFKNDYCIVVYDFRGQGRSELSTSRSVSIEDCYQDTLALMDFLKFNKIHYFGQSMGGMVGLRLAIRCPERIASLIVAGSGAGKEKFLKKINYWALVFISKTFGLKGIRKKILSFMFGTTSLSSDEFKQEPLIEDLTTTFKGRTMQFFDKIGQTISLVQQFAYRERKQEQRTTLLRRLMQHLKDKPAVRSEEPTSALQTLHTNAYAVFCLKKKNMLAHKHHPVI
mgnify:CR=1 FL=1